MRDSTKTLLVSVVPPIAIVVMLAVCYLRGDISAGTLLIGLALLASVWLVAGVWGYVDWRIRRLRRQRIRRMVTLKSASYPTAESRRKIK